MTENYSQLFEILVLIVFFAIIGLRIIKIYISNHNLNELIKVHFKKDDLKVIAIEKLNFKEKLRYGVPSLGIFRIYSYYFAIFSGKLSYNRKASVKDSDDQIGTTYLSITVKNRQTDQVKEYDFYLF